MSRRLRSPLCREDGSVLVAGLLLSLALLMLIGTAVDIGRAFIVRRELVSQADDAALSGSQALDLAALHAGRIALDPAQAQQTALETLAADPGVRGEAAASSAGVHVRVQRTVQTVLLRLVGVPRLTISAQATAAPRAP